VNAHFQNIEPLLCLARDFARERSWSDAHAVLRAARDYAEIYRSPVPAEVDAVAIIHRALSAAALRPTVSGPASLNARGDEEQMAVVIRLLVNSARLEFDATLECALIDLDGVPAIRISIDGPGQFPSVVDLGFSFRVARDIIDAAWTNATCGGRIDAQASQLELRIKGVRMCTDMMGLNPALLDSIRRAERCSRLLASADAGAKATAAVDDLRTALQEALADIDVADDPLQPGDVAKFVRDAANTDAPENPVSVTVSVEGTVPPIAVRRNRIARMIELFRNLAGESLPHGGEMGISLELNATSRALSISVHTVGMTEPEPVGWFMPSIQRCIVETHRGGIESDIGARGVTVLMSMPDTVARTLDDWLPGWDTFTPRSIQMLRLLKSGGPVPPEEIILAGVLEDELERRLLPRLGVAPASHLAHDLKARPGLPGSSPARVEKVLGQIRRGKPKKEICSAAYAGELLHLYSIDDRHKKSIGIILSEKDALETLSRELVKNNINYYLCLKLVPAVLNPP